MRILILLPVILYLGLLVFNLNLLTSTESINIYGIVEISAPALLYSSMFFVVYSIFIIFVFDSILAFVSRKIKKLEKEVFELKGKLYDEREDELVVFLTEQKQRIENFVKNQDSVFDKLKTEFETSLQKQKSDTDRILDKFGLLDEGILDKIKKTFKGK